MKKSLLLLLFLFQISALVIAQPPPKRGGFQHGVGLKGSLYSFSDELEPLYGLTYRTKYNLINNWTDFSGSINAGLSAEYHHESTIDSVSFFAGDLPLSLELNIGHFATKDFRTMFGFFAGAGYTFSYLNEDFNEAPILTFGIRTALFSQSFEVRYIRYFSEERNYAFEHSISLIINLGDYIAAAIANNKISDFMRPFPKYPQ